MTRPILGFLLMAGCLALPFAAPAQEPLRLPPLNDPPSAVRLPGKFIWHDLATPALDKQQAFYEDVFAWTYLSPGVNSDDYVLVLNGGRAIAGMFQSVPMSGEEDGATWINLFSVDDVDMVVDAAIEAGGKVEVSPVTIARRGRHALLRDPANAVFGVLRSDSGDGPDEEVPIGDIIWVDLFARDVEAMADFYGRLAPWEITERVVAQKFEGRFLTAQGLPRGGIVPVDEEANRSAWVPYVRVADVQATLDRAVAGGGFVIVAPDPAIRDGKLGIFVDPHGGVIGAVEYDYDEVDDPVANQGDEE